MSTTQSKTMALLWPGRRGAVLAAVLPLGTLGLSILDKAGLLPALVIAVPVGFVNVVESKERIWQVCQQYDIPVIAAMGRKGGSTVAAAICNALLYIATDRKI